MIALIPSAPSFPTTLEDAHQAIAELREQVASLTSLARLDSLTNIANRRAFDEHMASAFAYARRKRNPLSIAIFDIDNFKHRNDEYGHAAGDRALQLVSQQLTAHVRASDFIARIGGEEFAILLPNTKQEHAAELCGRIAKAVRKGCAIGPPLTFCAGVAELDNTMAHPSTILDRADQAMYSAKRSGKDRVCIYHPTFKRAVEFSGRLGVL
jgi:diguanylate cyclase (GGDEF)-like protein